MDMVDIICHKCPKVNQFTLSKVDGKTSINCNSCKNAIDITSGRNAENIAAVKQSFERTLI